MPLRYHPGRCAVSPTRAFRTCAGGIAPIFRVPWSFSPHKLIAETDLTPFPFIRAGVVEEAPGY